MICPDCGLSYPGESAGDPCPRCSLQQAIALSDAETAGTNSLADYELLRLIGRGAMGVVWLAREKRLDRLVALKLIAAGAGPQFAQRLLREAQSAARLSHPNIVGIHALGGSGSSTFLAMEFQEGGNLNEHLHGKPMAPKAAAELAAKLAGALVHAHAAGVLHRDLKPSNVMLDASGEPRLADFGLAGPLEGHGDLTRPGQMAGTPAYIAPELLAGFGNASVKTDVYGLGVILYICLTGTLPFAGDSTTALLRSVAVDEPAAPRLIRSGIPQDLETITMKCLEKAPARRFASAQALQDDLRRFLRGEPILARPVGPIGKTTRWCRRRPAAATALVAGSLILLLLAVGGPVVALRIENSRRTAADAAATATAINDFLQKDLLAQASPFNQPDRDLKLRTVLDQASARIEKRFADRPVVEAAIRQTLGDTYFALGEYDQARRHIERALELREPKGNSEPTVEALTSKQALASIYYLQGNLSKAEALFLQVLEAGKRIHATELTLQAMNLLAAAYQLEGRYGEAETLLGQALEIKQRVSGPEDPETLVMMNNLISTYVINGDYDHASAYWSRLLAVRMRVSGPNHPDTITVMSNLAFMERLKGNLAEAEKLYAQTLAIQRRVSGPEHLFTLYTAADLAVVYQDQGRLADAEALTSQTLEIVQRTNGTMHPLTLRLESQLGEILLLEKRPEPAEKILRSALEAADKAGIPAWKSAITRSRLGEALTGLHRYADAEPYLTDAYLSLQRENAKIPYWSKPEVQLARMRLYRLYTEWGKPAQAGKWAQAGLPSGR